MSKKKSFLNNLFGKNSSEDALLEQLSTNIIVNDYKGLLDLLGQNVPLDKPDALGRFPIHLAVIKDRFNVICLLKEHGADLNQRNEDQLTPLMLSIQYNALDTVKELLENGADPYLKNLEGKTAEQLAEETNNTLILKVFQDHIKNSYQAKALRNQSESLKFDKQDKDFNVLLDKASKRQKELEVQQAIQKKKQLEANLEKQKSEKLLRIEQAYQKKLDQFRKLANKKETDAPNISNSIQQFASSASVDPNELWKCVKRNDAKQLESFLTMEPSLESIEKSQGWSMLTYSLLTNKTKLFHLLLEAGAQVNTTYSGQSLLYHAVQRKDLDSVKTLFHFGVNPNLVVDDFSPLELALQQKNEEMITCLLKNGAQVNYCGEKSAPILVIIESNSEAFIALLVQYGLDVDRVVLGRSPLEWCVLHKKESVFESLVHHGANINIGREDGNALICKIVKSGRYWFLTLLIELGADLNVLDNKGRSPLEIAIVDNEVKIVKSLVNGGASIQLKNADHLTPLQVARRLGRSEIVMLLEATT